MIYVQTLQLVDKAQVFQNRLHQKPLTNLWPKTNWINKSKKQTKKRN